MVGQTVGKYRVVSRLGRGGMGTVYKAVDETLDREVAIKCLNPDVADKDTLKRFRAEAVMLARLNHPNIATLFELTEHDGQLLMVMEFVGGETFDKLVDRVGPMPVDRAAHLCVQVLDALASAHRAGVVHRDLKPANLMLTESGRAKVMDFGIARMSGAERLTNDGFMVGTPAYMSPEQVLGGEIDGRADLYSMGVVFYRLITAQLPFKADSGIAMVQKQLHDVPTPVRQLRTELPEACEDILTRALAKAPADRYPTADHFKAALEVLSDVAAAEMLPTLVLPSERDSIAEVTVPTPLFNVRALTEDSGTALPAAPPLPAAAPVKPRTRVAAAAVVGAVLLIGIPTTALLVWRARTTTHETAVAPAAAPVTSNAPVSAAVTAPSEGSGTVPTIEARPPASNPSETNGASASRHAAVSLVTFGNVKLLVLEDGKSRDRDAVLRLGGDGLQILDGDTILQSMPYREVIGLFQSHSREPRWTAPDGTAVPVIKVGGKFGFLKGTPDWVTLRTKKSFIPLRVQEQELGRMIAELEARTGTKIVRTR
jgi:serine/threonine-protein kinase